MRELPVPLLRRVGLLRVLRLSPLLRRRLLSPRLWRLAVALLSRALAEDQEGDQEPDPDAEDQPTTIICKTIAPYLRPAVIASRA